MTTITARVDFEDKEHNQASVRVQTSRCFYSVAIQGLTATVVGPGVEKEYDFDGGGDMIPFENVNHKGLAMIAVIMLEEEE